MNYNGIKDPEDRAAMIAWLRSLSSSPKPLPSAAAIAEEVALLAPPEEDAAENAIDAAADKAEHGGGH